MNNKNWIAVFLGVICLIVFVSVIGSTNNWVNNKNTTNPSAVPQQVTQTLRDMETKPSESVPTKIDSNDIINEITNTENSQASYETKKGE